MGRKIVRAVGVLMICVGLAWLFYLKFGFDARVLAGFIGVAVVGFLLYIGL